MDTYKNSCCYFGVVAEDNQYQVSYELTNMCNLKCNHCFNESDRDSHCGLPLEKVKRLIDELVSKNVKSFYITGGEPTIYPYFEEVLKHINLKGAEAILATNGLEIESIIPVIKRYVSPVGVFISLDGLYNIHDEFRNKQGAFEKVVENIKRLISQQIPVRISTVIWEKNIAQLEQMVEFVKKLGVYQIHFTVLVSVGRAKQNSMEVDENRYKEITGIAYLYEVDKQTIRRDIAFLSNCLPITTKSRNGGGIFLEMDFEKPKEYLSAEEENLLVRLSESLSQREKLIIHSIINKFSVPKASQNPTCSLTTE